MMNAVIQSTLSNIAIIFFMHLCMVEILNNENRLTPSFAQTGRILIMSSAVISMFYLPIQYGEYRFDLRLIPLVFFSVRWGWELAIPTLLITALWRLFLGGEGSVPGVVFGMILPVFVALVYRTIQGTGLHPVSIVFLFTVGWFISDIPIIIFVPDGWSVFKEIFLVRYVSYLLTALLLYLFIVNAERDRRVKKKLQYDADHDPLTGLYNIRYFQKAVKAFTKSTKQMFIVMIDVDHFKTINDTYGHVTGDLVLKGVSNVIAEVAYAYDANNVVVGRYGGEEFILFLAVDQKETMVSLVEAVRERVESSSFYTEKRTHLLKVTVSIGVSQMTDCKMFQKAVEQADKSLYDSKKNGRNQINYANDI
ncbi:diguanylate cyclase [Brevibacillus centrosporus]|uniref:GGDEF domain-containing protein n=1 Tax=Brevibacillus centrosporus TaxID=54910 RepID=UPI002E1C1A19|nr:diguanylate cyclase [Brevibacillus centrosporus]MED1951369.1 diguanylate cyclase [Brevibacillus centrosporus]